MGSMVDVVRSFRYLRALVIGDLMLDTYCEGSASRICSEGPVPVVRKTAEHALPGGAANSAANARALGAEVTLIGCLGGDTAGRALQADLRRRGVDCERLIVERAARTLHKLRILADGQYVVRLDDDEPLARASATRASILNRIASAYAESDLVIVADYGYGVVEQDVISTLRRLRASHPKPLLVDSKRLDRFPDLGATVITPNLLEARLVLERASASRLAPTNEVAVTHAQVAREILRRVDTQHVALTLAADGVQLASSGGVSRHIPAHPVARAHVAGAGDTFAAALALALATGADLDSAARIGVDAAGVSVSKRWTAVVTHQELLQRVSLRDHARTTDTRATDANSDTRAALNDTLAAVAEARRAGKTVVFTNGVFDILHAGHVEFLRRARELGDVLVVGVNSDAGARRLKGRTRPINSERDRLALVRALDAVDYAALFDEDTPAELIRALRPHIHAKGGDYATEPLPEIEAVQAVGGQVIILPLIGDQSTTGVIERIVAMATSHDGGGSPT